MAALCHCAGRKHPAQNKHPASTQPPRSPGGPAMPTKIIVSYDGTANEDDAIALGRLFANAGAEVALAYVRHTHEPDSARESLVQGEAQQLLERGAELFGDASVGRYVVHDCS